MSGRPELSKTELTSGLCALIGEILDIEDVTAEEDFFELGGTSLKGAVLIAQIERRFGHHLRLADLYEVPTPAGLCTRLRADNPITVDALSVAAFPSAQSDTAATPVFLVHLMPADLARALGRRRPVIGLSYGLGAVTGNTGWPPPVGVEALAAHYVAQMRCVRPEGPYHLAGYSNGGVIAWEMARQLRQAGADVGLLCLIDTRPPPVPRWRRVGWRTAVRTIISTPLPVLWLLAQRFALWRLIGVADRLSKMLSAVSETTLSETAQQRWERSDQPNRLGLIDLQRDAYRMTPLPGQPLLIEALTAGILSETIPVAFAYDVAGLTPDGHTLVQFPGDHSSIVKTALAEQVAAAIDAAIRAQEPEVTTRVNREAGHYG